MSKFDPEAREEEESAGGARWLLLIHQLPADPAYLRVKTLRRLKALGAVALKSSVYALPDRDSAHEDLHWLRREIVDGGGEATLAACRFLQGMTDREMVELFQAERNGEYAELVAAAEQALDAGQPSQSDLARLRQRLERIRERDHFQAPQRAAAEHALRALAKRAQGEATDGESEEHGAMERPRGATWVTRKGVFVDRMASGWLIRRFIDPAARFAFVEPDGYQPGQGELRFDMFEGEFTHEGDRCTFEVLIERFGLDEPGLQPIAEIVHAIDCKDDKYGRPETAGIATLLAGIASAHGDDRERMAAAAPIFDGLFERFRLDDSAG